MLPSLYKLAGELLRSKYTYIFIIQPFDCHLFSNHWFFMVPAEIRWGLGFISKSLLKSVNRPYCLCRHGPCGYHVKGNKCWLNRLTIAAQHVRVSGVYNSARFRLFKRKPGRRTLKFFLTFFDKINSENRCKGMLNPLYKSLFRLMQSFHIPYTVVRNNPYDVPVMPVSASDMVRIMVRYCAYQALKQAISEAETVHFVRWKNHCRM